MELKMALERILVSRFDLKYPSDPSESPQTAFGPFGGEECQNEQDDALWS